MRDARMSHIKSSDHLKDRTEEEDLQNNSNIMMLHKEGKSVREIADLVNKSKTTVHRIILQEKKKEDIIQNGSVPCEDAGQVGQSGQNDSLLFDSEQEDSFYYELDENF